MNEFYLYGKIGFDHIVELGAFDHVLFLIALSAGVFQSKYKQLAILITAFTIGHSFTLICSSYNLIYISIKWIEFLIPLTIVFTSALNLWLAKKTFVNPIFNYLLILVFGFVHGMGFANDLRMMLAEADAIFIPLISMNIGLEFGQILLVAFIFLLSFLGRKYLAISESSRMKYLSVLALAGGLYFTILNLPFNN